MNKDLLGKLREKKKKTTQTKKEKEAFRKWKQGQVA